jgi:hypothetical protein
MVDATKITGVRTLTKVTASPMNARAKSAIAAGQANSMYAAAIAKSRVIHGADG